MADQIKNIRIGLTTLQDGEGRWMYVLVQFDEAAGVLVRTDMSIETFDSADAAYEAGSPVLQRALAKG